MYIVFRTKNKGVYHSHGNFPFVPQESENQNDDPTYSNDDAFSNEGSRHGSTYAGSGHTEGLVRE